MKKSIWIFVLGLCLLLGCEFETDTVPKVTPPKVDTTNASSVPKTQERKPKVEATDYTAYENKLKNLPQIVNANNELKSQNKELLKSKIVDEKKDSLFSIKFGKTLDTNFVSEYEFYINKKTKAIKVYDKGEDRMIPLEDWKKMNEVIE